MNRADQIEASAKEFDRQHPEVWELFAKFTLDRIGVGFQHYSAKSIFERIRWETDRPSYDKRYSWKLNNNYHAVYSRWFMQVFPEHDGFFRTRARPSELAPPVRGTELTPRDFA